jgi:hypothetical protein
MPGAMDRFLTVNDFSGSGQPAEPPDSSVFTQIDSMEQAPSLFESAVSNNQGPCLYLGPQGQRCARPALPGGFCSRHQPGSDATKTQSRGIPKIAAVGIGILAALWPIIFDILRIIIRWFRAHG